MLVLGTTLAVAGLVGACTPVGVAVSAGATVATAASEERGLEQTTKDTYLYTEINRLWFDHDHRLPLQATATVREGKALLTGVVDDADLRRDAVRLTWNVDGVTQVINEIKVQGESSMASNSGGDAARDLWIQKKLEAKLLFDSDILSINYSIDVSARTVYLFGIAQSRKELDDVIAYARDTDHVRRVVSHVRLKQVKAND